jgi:hypothetical protein
MIVVFMNVKKGRGLLPYPSIFFVIYYYSILILFAIAMNCSGES